MVKVKTEPEITLEEFQEAQRMLEKSDEEKAKAVARDFFYTKVKGHKGTIETLRNQLLGQILPDEGEGRVFTPRERAAIASNIEIINRGLASNIKKAKVDRDEARKEFIRLILFEDPEMMPEVLMKKFQKKTEKILYDELQVQIDKALQEKDATQLAKSLNEDKKARKDVLTLLTIILKEKDKKSRAQLFSRLKNPKNYSERALGIVKDLIIAGSRFTEEVKKAMRDKVRDSRVQRNP